MILKRCGLCKYSRRVFTTKDQKTIVPTRTVCSCFKSVHYRQTVVSFRGLFCNYFKEVDKQ